MSLSLTTLGRLELRDDTSAALAGRRKPLAMLAYLARQSGRAVGRNELAALLWGDRDDARARQSLRQSLSELRTIVGSALVADASTVQLEAGTLHLDAAAFETAVAEANWSAALSHWQGDFLSGAEDLGDDAWRTWLEIERALLRKQLAVAYDRLTAETAARGQWNDVTELAERWTRFLPDDERAITRLANALRSAGRVIEASTRVTEWSERFSRVLEVELPADVVRLARTLERESRNGLPLGARALMSPDMVGRSDAFAMLTQSWTRTAAAAGHVIVIESDEGFGKTRLCAEFVRATRVQPKALVLETRAFPSEHNQQWSALRPLVAQLVDAPVVAGIAPEVLSILASEVPELRERFRHLPNPGNDNWGDAFRQALTSIGAEAPLLIVVDDAPAADDASQALLAGIFRRAIPGVLVILAGRRELWHASLLREDVQRSAAHVRRVELGALSDEQALAVIASMAPLAPSDAALLAGRLREASGGVPAQLVLLFQQLADDGTVAPDARGVWRLTRPFQERVSVPAAMREAFADRLASLSVNVRALADAAAVLGPRIELPILESVSALSSATFQEAFGELLSRRVLRQASSAREAYEFASEANRRVAYETIAPSRRQQLHEAAYVALKRTPNSRIATVETLDHHRLEAGSRGWRSPRRRAAVLAAVVVAIAVGTTMIVRLRAAVVDRGSSVLLADVQNFTGDPGFDRSLLTAATVALQQSRQVSVFSRARVAQVLTLMRRSAGDSALTERTAREVAERANVPVVVALSISRFDSTYELAARLVEPVSGRDLRVESSRVVGRGQILTGLDQLVDNLRRDLGEPRSSLGRNGRALPAVTTNSLEALHAFADGERAWSARSYATAVDAYSLAITLDSSFALAHSALAGWFYSLGNDRTKGSYHLDRALEQLSRLTEREQLTLRAVSEGYRGSFEEAVRLRGMLAERYPDRDGWMTYGTLLMRGRRCTEAIPALEHARQFDSTYANPLVNIATCYAFLGQQKEALRAYEQAAVVDTTVLMGGTLNQEFGFTLVRMGLIDSAKAMHDRMRRIDKPENRVRAYRSLAFVAMYRGRYGAAISLFDSAVVESRGLKNQSSEMRNLVLLAEAAITAGDRPRALATLDAAWALSKLYVPDPGFAMYIGDVFARMHQLSRAQAMLDSVMLRTTSKSVADESDRAMLSARMHLAHGHAAEARKDLELARDTTQNGYRLELLIETYDALQRPDSALAAAEQLAQEFRYGQESEDWWLKASLRVAQLAGVMGDLKKSRAAYESFISRWHDGDAGLPDLVEARRALQQLDSSRALARQRARVPAQ
ncbi:MAG: AAA family ATPase [Gemmatimonas sp.]